MFDINEFLTWLSAKFNELMQFFIDSLYNAFEYTISILPVPDFLLNITSFTIPSSISYFAEPLKISYGITVIISAYIARFILRRIPIIG